MDQTSILFLAFVCSMVISFVTTRIFRSFSLKFDIYAETGHRKIHTRPIPYFGGLAIFIGFFLPVLFILPDRVSLIFFLSSLIVTILGLMDDVYKINPIVKLALLTFVIILSSVVGFVSHLAPVYFFGGFTYFVNLGFTLFWVILVISAINAIDNMDGLAPGIGMIACFMFFLIGYLQFPDFRWALYSLTMVGSLLGFLPYNFHPAVIFMGDTGSLFLGFFLAMIGVRGQWSAHPLKSLIIPVVILSVPILDLIFIVLYRYLTGVTDGISESITYSGKDHLSHRIQQVRNFGQTRTVLIIYGLSTAVGLLGVIMRNTYPFEAAVALTIVGAIYAILMLLILPRKGQINWRWMEANNAGRE